MEIFFRVVCFTAVVLFLLGRAIPIYINNYLLFCSNYDFYKCVDRCSVFLCIAAVPSEGELRTFKMDRPHVKNPPFFLYITNIISSNCS